MKIRNLLRKSISKQFQYRLMSALLMLITSQLIFAQTKSITGKVVDEKGETVIGHIPPDCTDCESYGGEFKNQTF